MDSSHKLDAPNNDELQDIEQVADHSELSSIYPKAHDQWTGDLVSDDERERRRQKKEDTISFGIRAHFLSIGLLIPLPLIIAALIVAAALTYINEDNVRMAVIPGMFVFFAWLGITYVSYKKIHGLFYINALQAAPYAVILLALLGIIAFMLYHVLDGLHGHQLLAAIAMVSALGIIISIAMSALLLRLWTTPAVSGNAKVLVLGTFALVLLGTGIFFSLL